MGELLSWVIFFFTLVGLLLMLIYQLMCLADLEFDYINPYDSAKRINRVVLPEYITQAFLCFFYLMTGHWLMWILSIPYLYYNVRLYLRKRHLIDVTEVFNLLNREKKIRLFKLSYIILLIVFSLFWMIYSTLEADERRTMGETITE